MLKKVLITGGSGLLGLNWALSLRNEYNVTLCLHKRIVNLSGVKSTMCSLDSIDLISKLLKQEQPDVVINAAGLTSVEKCEEAPDLAEYINVTIAKNIAIACASEGIKLIHISTDHLFDGTQKFLKEEAPLSPINVYGLTKAKAEEVVFNNNENSLIIRTNFYGWGTSYRHSFSDFIINSLRKKTYIKLFDDIFYSPILIDILVQASHELVDKNQVGIFNIVGDTRISKYHFGKELAKIFKLNSNYITRSQIKSKLGLIPRPADMSLSNQKVSSCLVREVGSLDNHLEKLFQQENNRISMELNLL